MSAQSEPQTLSLALLRTASRLTQEELARRIGVSRMSIIRWEAGTTRPGSRTISRLAAALSVPAALILAALDGVAA